MTHYPQPHPLHRATRVQLPTAALIRLTDGQRAKAKLQVVSVTGGLLQLPRALSEGDFVEIAFQTQSGGVQGMAEMLHPVRSATERVLQPFRFVALGDDHHQALRTTVESLGDTSFAGLRSSHWTSPKP